MGGIASALNPIAPLMGLAGGVGNMVEGAIGGQNNKAAQKAALGATQNANNLAQQIQNMSPGQMGARQAAMTQPLSQQQINAVTGPVTQQMAAMGLGQAPGLMQSNIAAGLAPTEVAEQQMGQQNMWNQWQTPLNAYQNIAGTFANQIQHPQYASNAGAFSMGGAGGGTGTGTGGAAGYTGPVSGMNFGGALTPIVGANPYNTSGPFGAFGPTTGLPDIGSSVPSDTSLLNFGGMQS